MSTNNELRGRRVLSGIWRPRPARSRRAWLIRYGISRLILLPIAVLVVVTLCFLLVNLLPGNPAQQILGTNATASEIHSLNEKLGWLLPVFHRYGDYMGGLFHGSLGNSFYTGQPVSTQIGEFLPNTIELIIPAIFFGFIFGLCVGGVASIAKRPYASRTANTLITLLQSVPDFVIAILLIIILYSKWHVGSAPVGRFSITATPPPTHTGFLYLDTLIAGDWSLFGQELYYALLPTITLALAVTPLFARAFRAQMVAARGSPTLEFAHACGLKRYQVMGAGLRIARTTLLTYLSLLLAGLVGGAAIVEQVFSWPGIGQWAITAITRLDIPDVEGFTVVITAIGLTIFFTLEVLIAILDPRIGSARVE